MIPDLKLTNVAPDNKGAAKSMAETDGKLNFGDALGKKLPHSNAPGAEARKIGMTNRDRLLAALNDSLRRQAMIEGALKSGEQVKRSLGEERAVDDAIHTDAEARPAGETAADETDKTRFVALPAYLHTRELSSSLNVGGGTFSTRSGQEAAGGSEFAGAAAVKRAGHNKQHDPARSAFADVTNEASQADDKHAGSSRSLKDALDQPAFNKKATSLAGDVKPGTNTDTALAAARSSAQSPGQPAVQIQLVTADNGSTPAHVVTEAIKAEPAWAAYFRDTGTSANQPVKSLKIQLHPAELGTVTAHMRAAGDAIEVEITAETAEAHRHLTAEADEILRSLRQVGIDVDRISVHLADNGANTTAKNSSNQEWRNFSSFQGQDRGDGGSSQNGNSGRNGGNGQGSAQISESRGRQADGRYI